MPKQLIIDGQLIEVEDGITLLQACEQAGAEIPRFCYHERLSIAGNCRMCLVEVQGSPKPIASCAMGVNDLPPNKDNSPKVINTKSATVKKARRRDGSSCSSITRSIAPSAIRAASAISRIKRWPSARAARATPKNKRAVEEKYIGPLIKTSMNRCIHAPRCVRS